MRSTFTLYRPALLVALILAAGGSWGRHVAAQGQSVDDGKPSILVNPTSRGDGTATTIQEAIDRVAPGGQVLVLPGTYDETLTIAKGLTLRGIGGASGDVVISPAGTPRA